MPPDTALPPAEPGPIGFFLALLSCPLYLLEQLLIQLRPARDARNRRARSDASRLLRTLPRQ